MSRYHFCTYFDRNYLARGLALYRSLQQHVGSFELHVLCLDAPTLQFLREYDAPGLNPVGLDELEAWAPELRAARDERSRIEYYFTCTPYLARFILDLEKGIDAVTYLDADLYFFDDPAPVYDELGAGSILAIGHRFPERLAPALEYGLYNVGYLTFRNDETGRACLKRWSEQCLDWCHDRLENGRFADQKYLDEWPDRYPGFVELRHPGGGIAPWNLDTHAVETEGGRVRVNGRPLIFFHFHGLKLLGRFLVDPGLDSYGTRLDRVLRRAVYAPYVRELRRAGKLGGPAPEQTLRVKARALSLTRRLVYRRTLLIAGPLVAEIYLEPALRPLLSLWRAARRVVRRGRVGARTKAGLPTRRGPRPRDTRLLEAELARRPLPANYRPEDQPLFEHELSRQLPPVELEVIEGVRCSGLPALFKRGRMLAHSGIRAPADRFSLATRLKLAARAYAHRPPGRLTGPAVWVIDEWSHGYFHWLTDALPRLLALGDDARGRTLLLPARYRGLEYVTGSLTRLGMEDVVYIEPGEHVLAETLLVPSHTGPTGNPRADLVRLLRARLLEARPDNSAGTTGEHIYISRSAAGRRRVANEAALLPLLQERGFEVVHFEGLPWSEQVAIAASARHLVSLHGTGLTNMLFMAPGSAVLEIRRPDDAHNNCYFALAAALELSYHYDQATALADGSGPNRDVVVDSARFAAALDQMLARDPVTGRSEP